MKGQITFGHWLKKSRKSLGLTQAELAQRVGCATVTIRKIEAGERQPSRQVAGLLAESLGVKTEQRSAFVQFARGRSAVRQPGQKTRRTEDDWWAITPSPPNNLPAQTTRLIGREQDVKALRRRLQHTDARLITLTGPPGIGKTRLGLQVAAELADYFEDGSFFIPLDLICEPALVAPTIIHTLGLTETEPIRSPRRLSEFLQDKHMLLLLDNFEQVVTAAPLVADLVASCPWLSILVTSRIALRVRGENQYPVPSLALPDLAHLPPVERLADYAGINLFMDRAKAVMPAFNLTADNAMALAAICARLDGLPLAIELVSARIQVLPPQALLARLTGHLLLRSDGLHDINPHQRTLYKAIDWSYQLLREKERALFVRLAVFVGGWTLEAGEFVCGEDSASPLESPEALNFIDGLMSLINSSLVYRHEEEGEARYAMLETIRMFALERLLESDFHRESRQRHAMYYINLIETAETHIAGPDQALWFRRLEREHINLQMALDWLDKNADLEMVSRLAGGLWQFWLIHGHLDEGRTRLEKIISSPDFAELPIHFKSNVLNGAGVFAGNQGDYPRSRQLLQVRLELQQELKDVRGVASSLNNLGMIALNQGAFSEAEELFGKSLVLFQGLGYQPGISIVFFNLGLVALYKRELNDAALLFQKSLEVNMIFGNQRIAAWCIRELGIVALEKGDLEQAGALLSESLIRKRELGDKETMAWTFEGLARLAEERGNPARAAQLLGAAEALRESIGIPLPIASRSDVGRIRTAVQSQLGDLDYSELWANGHAMELEQAITYALSEDE